MRCSAMTSSLLDPAVCKKLSTRSSWLLWRAACGTVPLFLLRTDQPRVGFPNSWLVCAQPSRHEEGPCRCANPLVSPERKSPMEIGDVLVHQAQGSRSAVWKLPRRQLPRPGERGKIQSVGGTPILSYNLYPPLLWKAPSLPFLFANSSLLVY
jgi:hypothetical protein